MNRSFLGVVALLSVWSTVGCSSSAALSPSRVQPLQVAKAGGDAPCRVTGRPAVIARRAFAAAGVEVLVRSGGFEVRFATGASSCVSVETGAADGPTQSPCPATPGAPTYSASLGFAGDPGGGGVVRSPLGESSLGEAAGLLPMGGSRFLMFGVDAGYAVGGRANRQLRAQPIASWGEPVGASIALSPPEASVVGAANVAVGPNGEGLAAYLASVGDEVDVVATSFACNVSMR